LLQWWSNAVLLETEEGVVLFDAGFEFYGPRIVKELRALTDKPVRYIIYGHGHADHAFGAGFVLKDAEERGHVRPVIIAHQNLPRRFDRYREMLSYHEHINRLQFSIPDNLPAFPRNYLYPDLTFAEALSFRLGQTIFELRHAQGETDDAAWLWVPERKLACLSDLWVWSCPNIGNPFKVQRYEVEWAQALETIAAHEPELLLPGHGPALAGKERIREALLTVARALRFLHREVVRMLNEGKWPEDILNGFEWPAEFADSPYLAPIYGHPRFIVQGILRRYHGWFDGNASHVFPSRSEEIAAAVVGLAGSGDKILAQARTLSAEGNTQLALHLVDFVVAAGAEPRTEALALKAEFLEVLAAKEKSLIARNIFGGEAARIRKRIEKGS
jgi:alkyl sulfatase BDS1-like metallo-beta-lactamase superfamily hydrolase